MRALSAQVVEPVHRAACAPRKEAHNDVQGESQHKRQHDREQQPLHGLSLPGPRSSVPTGNARHRTRMLQNCRTEQLGLYLRRRGKYVRCSVPSTYLGVEGGAA